MIFEIKETQVLCEWLMAKGLNLEECANVLINMESGDTFSLALLKTYEFKKQKEVYERNIRLDWSFPITP